MSSCNGIIKLNIGGTVFQTTVTTLTRFDGFFKTAMETDVPVAKDDTGAIFIDRSPKHFDLILNFMRDGDAELPSKHLKAIKTEAEYYLLIELVALVKKCENEIRAASDLEKRINFNREVKLFTSLQKIESNIIAL